MAFGVRFQLNKIRVVYLIMGKKEGMKEGKKGVCFRTKEYIYMCTNLHEQVDAQIDIHIPHAHKYRYTLI